MVRFHWPVEGTQHCAWVPHGGMKLEEDKGVRHITVDMEVGAACLAAPKTCCRARRVCLDQCWCNFCDVCEDGRLPYQRCSTSGAPRTARPRHSTTVWRHSSCLPPCCPLGVPHLRAPTLCPPPQLAGQNETVMSLLTVPADYLNASKVSPLGIMLAHGLDAEETWRGPLLERLACHFAAAGHVVARYFCPLKEQVRARPRPAVLPPLPATPGAESWALPPLAALLAARPLAAAPRPAAGSALVAARHPHVCPVGFLGPCSAGIASLKSRLTLQRLHRMPRASSAGCLWATATARASLREVGGHWPGRLCMGAPTPCVPVVLVTGLPTLANSHAPIATLLCLVFACWDNGGHR